MQGMSGVVTREAVGVQLAAFERPVAGVHAHETPPEPVSGVEAPAQISAVPPAAALGGVRTGAVALPGSVPAQVASLREGIG